MSHNYGVIINRDKELARSGLSRAGAETFAWSFNSSARADGPEMRARVVKIRLQPVRNRIESRDRRHEKGGVA